MKLTIYNSVLSFTEILNKDVIDCLDVDSFNMPIDLVRVTEKNIPKFVFEWLYNLSETGLFDFIEKSSNLEFEDYLFIKFEK